MTTTSDVLIVGAGPTGLTLAAQLSAFGISPRIVDRRLDRVHESRALALQPRTLEVLSGLGVTRTMVERGNDAVQLRLHFGRRIVTIRLFDIGLEDTAYPFLLFLSQAETEAILNEHLAARGVTVERGVELVSFSAGSGEVTSTLRDVDGRTEELRCRYLIGCDGAHSTVREHAGIAFEGGTYPQTFVLADLEVDGDIEPGAAHAFPGADGILLFFPLARPATWRIIGMRPSSGDGGDGQETEPLTLGELQLICDRFTGGTLRLRDPVWLTHFRLHHRQAVRYRSGPVFLAGDAAHVHSPAGGQGMNTGIQDAWNLGWKLALVLRGVANAALLDSYESERLPVGRFVLRFTDRASSIATSRSAALRIMRTKVVPRVLPLVLRLRGRAFAFRTLSQLAISYRDSPAVEEGEHAPELGPSAGERLPDVRIVSDGRELWLHEALHVPAYHLLLCGPATGWDTHRLASVQHRHGDLLAMHQVSREPGDGVLLDPNGEALASLGAEQAAHYVVRPDGHVGYRDGGTDTHGAERYLARWLSAAAAVRPVSERFPSP